ncbi:hypothetical protein JMJ35_007169 [Cladonia borealis]|uniref:Uncharacterized protein n=1 Tax=Cladonia borealis TaxID=184061 RepID=A0AA39QWW3_9LECA|nr:hypothetical protein JMJ35_007169 [Cladonia borealis]
MSQPTDSSPPPPVPSTPVASQAARDALASGKAKVAANPTFAVGLQNLGPASISSQRLKARFAARSATPIPQQQQPLPTPPPLQTTPDPNDPIQSKHQWKMLYAFLSWGRLGLSKVIYQEARARASDHGSWDLLAQDETKELYVYQLLNLLPDAIIISLIKNTLAFDYHNDLEVKRFVVSDMMPKEMLPMAGIYVNIARRSKIGLMPNVIDRNAGRWLTSNQVKRLIQKVEIYLANKQDPNSLAWNSAIDNAFGRFNPSSSATGRRFTLPPNSASAAKVKEWLEIIEHQYCTNIDQSDLDIPFRRCPMEIGWAQDIGSRLKAHISNNNTTPLFGLVNAISRQSIVEGGAAFPSPMQLILFPIWKDDMDFKKIAEILGSVLCSSYWIYGGLNYAWAGGSVNVTFNDPEADNWVNSAQNFASRSHREGATDFARVINHGDHAEKARQISVAKANEQIARRDLINEKQKVGAQKTAVKELKAKYDAVEGKRKEKARQDIEEGDEWVKELEEIIESNDRQHRLIEAVDMLHRLSQAKLRGAKEEIAELEDDIADVDWEILEAAIAKAEELAARVRTKAAVRADTERAQPEKSQHSSGSAIYLSDD